jgi:hypothetical protein
VASGGIWANLRLNTISWDQRKSGCDNHADAMPIFRFKVCKIINDYKSQLLLFDISRKKVVALLPIKFTKFKMPLTSWMSAAIYKV